MTFTFDKVCNLLEGVETISTRQPRLPSREEKEDILHKTRHEITQWFKTHRQALDSPETDGGALLSIMFPHRRKDRVYGLQPPGLSKKILKVLHLNHGNRMLFERWATDPRGGDLGHYIQLATKSWDGTIKNKRLFSIGEIDKILTQLAANSRFSDAAIKRQRDMNADIEFAYIINRLESFELKWFTRVILRDYTTIELEETYFFKEYHFLLPDLLKFQDDFDAAFNVLRKEFGDYPSVPDNTSMERSMRAEAAGRLKAVVGVKVARPLFHKAWSFKHCLQLVGNRPWAAEVKYDGEYCEIHVDVDDAPNDIKIFSKNGKDATKDRQLLHDSIRQALRIGQSDCFFNRKCIVLGEMVLYSDKARKILPFSKIRKHISRSGSFLGTLQDSLPHDWEHLMLVYFDVLMLDNEPVMHRCLQDRRNVLRELISIIPGRSQRSEWTLIDFKSDHESMDLTQAFARTLAHRQEGLILKPLHAPYLPLFAEVFQRQPNYFIKIKKDYLADMGGQRDLGDFAVIGARYDSRVAPKTKLKPLFWTHYYLGCLTNKLHLDRRNVKPKFKVVGCLSLEKCIPKSELKYLNDNGRLQEIELQKNGSIDAFDVDHGLGFALRMSVAFRKPFVAEILGGGYEKLQNETFEMLRHPRIKKIHHDRTWKDTITMEELQQMAEEKWEVPNADQLGGLAKDVAIYAKKYLSELDCSQISISDDMTQETTQCTTQRTTQELTQQTLIDVVVQQASQQTTSRSTQESQHLAPNTSAIQAQQTVQPSTQNSYEIPETQEEVNTCTNIQSTRFPGSKQGISVRASRDILPSLLVREDTSERLENAAPALAPKVVTEAVPSPTLSETSSEEATSTTTKKRSFAGERISPPPSKRIKIARGVLEISGGNHILGSFDYESQGKILHVYAAEGWKVQVHGSMGEATKDSRIV